MRRPRVEILYFDGCPNHEPARELVEQVAAELGLQAEIELVEVADAETATRLRFLGSPSVRVDGRDVELAPTSAATLSSPAASIDASEDWPAGRRPTGSGAR